MPLAGTRAQAQAHARARTHAHKSQKAPRSWGGASLAQKWAPNAQLAGPRLFAPNGRHVGPNITHPPANMESPKSPRAHSLAALALHQVARRPKARASSKTNQRRRRNGRLSKQRRLDGSIWRRYRKRAIGARPAGAAQIWARLGLRLALRLVLALKLRPRLWSVARRARARATPSALTWPPVPLAAAN